LAAFAELGLFPFGATRCFFRSGDNINDDTAVVLAALRTSTV
jgi:hypothetical protein